MTGDRRLRLCITTLPNRKGRWICLEDAETSALVKVLAKFRNDEATDLFRQWVQAIPGLTYIDERTSSG